MNARTQDRLARHLPVVLTFGAMVLQIARPVSDDVALTLGIGAVAAALSFMGFLLAAMAVVAASITTNTMHRLARSNVGAAEFQRLMRRPGFGAVLLLVAGIGTLFAPGSGSVTVCGVSLSQIAGAALIGAYVFAGMSAIAVCWVLWVIVMAEMRAIQKTPPPRPE